MFYQFLHIFPEFYYGLQLYVSTGLDKMLFFNPKVLIFFLFLHENISCGYPSEATRRGASNEYLQHMFSWRNKKNIYLIPILI